MGLLRKLYRGESHIDFPRTWRWGIVVSVVLLLVSVGALVGRGLNLGIDFEGGTSWELPANGRSVDDVRTTLEPFGAANAKIQVVGNETLRISTTAEAESVAPETYDAVSAALAELAGVEPDDVSVTRVTGTWQVTVPEGVTAEQVTAVLEPLGQGDAVVTVEEGSATVLARSQVVEITEALAELVDVPPSDVNVSTVGPSWGEEITRQAIRALIFFFIAIALYISVRLEWKMAVGALVAVVHDIVITVGVYAVFQFEVTPGTVIAFLTILGYSLYDTIVVYDRVQENASRLTTAGKFTYTEIMNMSLNQVFSRSINTTVTSLLPVLALLVVGAYGLGAVTLQEFALALFVGLMVGAYSSIYVATPLVTWLKEREPRYRQIRERTQGGRSRSGSLATAVGSAAAADGDDGGSTRTTAGDDADDPADDRAEGPRPAAVGTATGAAPAWQGSHPPRPRKKTKRRR